MPTYTINGKRVTSEKPLTEEEIDELASSLGGTPVSPVEQIPGQRTQAPAAGEPVPSASERMINNALMGAAMVPPLAMAGRGLQALFRGSKVAPYLDEFARAVMPQSGRALAAEGAIGAASGVAGGEIGQQVAQKAGEQYRPLGEFVGGAGAGVLANTAVRNVPEMFSTGMKAVMGGEEAQRAANMLGSIKARQKIQTALDANPSLAGDLQRSSEIEKLTGIRLPIKAAAKGDPTIAGYVSSETARGENAAFTALLAQQEKAAIEAEKAARRALAADPKDFEAITKLEAAQVQLENVRREAAFNAAQAKRSAQITQLDERIADLSSGILSAAGKEDTGARLTNLLQAKEKQVRGEFKPLYGDLLEKAKKDGVVLESPQVAGLYNWVRTSKSEDVFADFPGLYAKINRLLAPQKASVSGKFAEKYPNLVKTQEGTYSPMSVDDIDSLKREINKAIGDTNDRDKLRRLVALKQQFDGALDSIPGDFTASLRDLDNLYASRVGLPFNENGVVKVNRARFVEDVVPQLTEKPSAVRQILAAAGDNPEAAKIIEDAFMVRLSNIDGIVNKDSLQINPGALNAFIRRKAEIIDQVPGLRQKLEGLSGNAAQLKDARSAIVAEQQNAKLEAFENVWSKAYGATGGFRGYVQSALKRPEQLDELIALAGTNKTLQEGLKAAVLDIGASSANRMEFFKANADTINTLFGPGHAKRVEAVLEAGQRLKDNPLGAKINPTITQQTGFQQATGSKPEQLAAEYRNPVMGTFRTVGNILSRFLQNRSSKAEAAEVQQFLANPQAVEDASVLIAELEKSGRRLSEKGMAAFKRLSKNTASAALFGGLAPVIGGTTGLMEREPVQQFEEVEVQ